MKRVRGFTLIELMTVVTIVAILAAFAISSYQKQMRKSRRADAKQALSQLALLEEKFRSNNTAYSTNVTTLGSTTTSPGKFYTISAAAAPTSPTCVGAVTPALANSFKLSAVAISSGPQAADTGCTTMVLTSLCGSVTKTPTTCW